MMPKIYGIDKKMLRPYWINKIQKIGEIIHDR